MDLLSQTPQNLSCHILLCFFIRPIWCAQETIPVLNILATYTICLPFLSSLRVGKIVLMLANQRFLQLELGTCFSKPTIISRWRHFFWIQEIQGNEEMFWGCWVVVRFIWFIIGLKLRIKVLWWIPIWCWTCLELFVFVKCWTSGSLFYVEISLKIQETSLPIFKSIIS